MSEPVDREPAGGRHHKPFDDTADVPVIGSEDVLAAPVNPYSGPPSAPRPPARRSPWNRPRDRVVAALILVAALTGGLLIWAGSESRSTISQTAQKGQPLPPAPDAVPGSLTELWRAPDGAVPVPVAGETTVVTASGGDVLGRDPLTGAVRWQYSRDLQLCTASRAWTHVLAVFRKDGLNNESGCSEVVELDPDTGHRTAQRTGSAQLGTRLVSDGAYVTAYGPTLLNTWRDDLVETVEYGRVPALVNPGKQPRTGCSYGSVAAAAGQVGVLERCPRDQGDRITVLQAVPKDSDQPEVSYSQVLPGTSAQLVAMSGDNAAVAMPAQRLLLIYGPDGSQIAAYPLDLPAADLARDPAGGVASTSVTSSNVYWFTGSKLMALSRDTLTPLWTLGSALGPGVMFDHQLVVPIQGGLAVLNEQNGSTIRTIGLDRHGYTGPVRLTAVGPVLLEQRGDTVVALR
ncbi:Rv3212 family protein [Amycolatopsis taiwanensis]|uniref:Pyrrolo-quinoline quinone repeat domain-containing protein n=1 Tax=Amycolatopsis taiwanensis TaxID=342230 RepID=A0A9W6R634_9PSEU|nr:PQQ-binding-like beta-propeller repeat protein [Amycolatopsis taiwanensis]GLY68282.1 hypothetical protein Atai01_49010 [Amycolatopsis taiwanensis]